MYDALLMSFSCLETHIKALKKWNPKAPIFKLTSGGSLKEEEKRLASKKEGLRELDTTVKTRKEYTTNLHDTPLLQYSSSIS